MATALELATDRKHVEIDEKNLGHPNGSGPGSTISAASHSPGTSLSPPSPSPSQSLHLALFRAFMNAYTNPALSIGPKPTLAEYMHQASLCRALEDARARGQSHVEAATTAAAAAAATTETESDSEKYVRVPIALYSPSRSKNRL